MQRNSKSGHEEACVVLTEAVIGFSCLLLKGGIVKNGDVSFDVVVGVVDNTFLVATVGGKVPRYLFEVLEKTFSESDVTSISWLS